jgi:arabinogalactan endo-1,4-beta-galactosidase
VNLDLHYSDTWADPEHQEVPAAWNGIISLDVLKDSVYNYTYRTLQYLSGKGLMPEMVQIGNEINCGMMKTNTAPAFPSLDACSEKWQALGEVINSAIKAVRDVSVASSIKPQIILHVADPKNIEWWFDNIQSKGKVSNYDIIGISYYPLWHTGIPFSELQGNIARFRLKYFKKVMVVETGYPWTNDSDDSFNNLFGSQPELPGYPFTPKGQHDFLAELTQKVISAGGSGVMIWEPAWISSSLVTQWGTGSSLENVTFFDFNGNTLEGIDFMNREYSFP